MQEPNIGRPYLTIVLQLIRSQSVVVPSDHGHLKHQPLSFPTQLSVRN